MDNEDVIRHQMEDTRTSLTDKLESLEQQVVNSVHDATASVAHTVEAVKDSVQGTVTSVTDTVQETVTAMKESMRQGVDAVKGFFDIPHHVNCHPWAMMGGSLVVGFVVGSVVGGRGGRANNSDRKSPRAPSQGYGNGRHENAAPPSQSSPGLFSILTPEISKLKNLALGKLMDAVRERIQKAAPPDLSSSLNEIITNITHKITGQVT